jgi:hypothetical protein
MRITIAKWAAAFAVVAASAAAAPAMAGGGDYAGGCSPCGGGYATYNYAGTGYGYAGYEALPDPTPVTRQYYYADQGPTYSGPGQFAPAPTYQETAIGWRGYPRYDGGPYANPYNHFSYTANYGYRQETAGPVVFTPRASYYGRPNYRYGYSVRPRVRYGYAQRSHYGHRYAQPRVIYGSRHGHAPRHGYHQQQRPLRRAY